MASILEARKTPTTLGIHGVLLLDRKDAFGSTTTCLNTYPNHESSSTSSKQLSQPAVEPEV